MRSAGRKQDQVLWQAMVGKEKGLCLCLPDRCGEIPILVTALPHIRFFFKLMAADGRSFIPSTSTTAHRCVWGDTPDLWTYAYWRQAKIMCL